MGIDRALLCVPWSSTIDWYDAWPRPALLAVAHHVLSPELPSAPIGPRQRGVASTMATTLSRASVEVHESVSGQVVLPVLAMA